MNNIPEGSSISQFSILEYEMVRGQINLLLNAIWRLEMGAVAGFAIFYSWAVTVVDRNEEVFGLPYFLIFLIPFAISILLLARLKIEYALLMRLGQYSNRLERLLYGGYPLHFHFFPIGWEGFLRRHPPDELKFLVVFRRYSNTGRLFAFIALVNLIIFLTAITAYLRCSRCGSIWV